MTPDNGRLRFDPLQIFAISLAACIAAVLFLLGVLADVTPGIAATRAIVGWVLLSLLGIGIAMLIRWVLATPGARN